MAAGGIMYMHDATGGGWVFMIGLAAVLFTMWGWWHQVIREAHAGDHTPVVQLHFRYGMILFIASEVMFFVAWFWAYFRASLFPSAVESVGGVWPPEGTEVLNPMRVVPWGDDAEVVFSVRPRAGISEDDVAADVAAVAADLETLRGLLES